MTDDDFPQKRAGFIKNHIWVTPYSDQELWPAGGLSHAKHGGDGLPTWTQSQPPNRQHRHRGLVTR